jgi:hypothetical protein
MKSDDMEAPTTTVIRVKNTQTIGRRNQKESSYWMKVHIALPSS